VIGVKVGEQLHVDAPDRQLELVESDCGTAAGVDEELLVAGLDQRAGAEAVGLGIGTPVPSSVTRKSEPVMD
jgi:hypothetical protein